MIMTMRHNTSISDIFYKSIIYSTSYPFVVVDIVTL